MRFAIKGTDPRFPLLRELLLADGHTLVPEAEADVVIPSPWDPAARYAASESYLIANAALTAEGAAALLKKERPLSGARVLVTAHQSSCLCRKEDARAVFPIYSVPYSLISSVSYVSIWAA